MNFNSPAPHSVVHGVAGGETPHASGSGLGQIGPGSVVGGSVIGHGGPGSVLGPSSLVGFSSLLGASIQPNSLLHRDGGPNSVAGGNPLAVFSQTATGMSNLNPGSIYNMDGPRSVYQHDVNPSSVMAGTSGVLAANLAVPMTPLDGEQIRDAHERSLAAAHGPPASNIPTMIPQTPATALLDVPFPQLQNIVSTVNLGVPLDLKKIALHARNAEFNPKRFAAVIMRIREPRTTALIFSSGKMVCTGAKSEEASRLAARKYARIVQKLGFEAKFTEFKVQNMVGSCDVRFAIQLEGLCITHAQFSTYEPELFPGLIYRMVVPRVVLLIFVSGKVVITGAKYKKEIDDAFSQIYPILKGFKK